ncbi:MAG: D-alanyl-D-alanine carboxypeptidase [Rhodovulum sulfidophilum]|uniref:D-alanyl-D-alanine carboxypeptidase n=1 Tax=Rhodovulum sulfidophilum TaxID=35806 RepID=A0A2W5NK84_RHOSU|nr:MAG: D-alanyl-D-alanine carboxypeptidase [Rhodovulum sulfidophilum]
MSSTHARGLVLALGLSLLATISHAQQFASYVMDARTGKVIQATNAETRVHPASLTKMMTLYIVFDQIKRGRMSLDQKVTISAHAAAEPPSKLGLKAGQKIELRYLIRAAAIKSANDAATALGEAVGGSEPGFAKIMNQYAKAMGLRNTTFVNANGLTRAGHMSTAHDMAEIGRRLYYDFPQYYNIFSREATSAGLKTVQNTNRRLLDAYPGADGIKTGYTRAAGFNLVSSAQRGNKRVIVAVLGARSSAARNAEVARLMDAGFSKMPTQARIAMPAPLAIGGSGTRVAAAATPRATTVALVTPPLPAERAAAEQPGGARVLAALPVEALGFDAARPMPRAMSADAAITRNSASIAAAIAEVNTELSATRAASPRALAAAGRPAPRPVTEVAAAAPMGVAGASTFAAVPPSPAPRPAEEGTMVASNDHGIVSDAGAPGAGGKNWGIQIGSFRSKGDAERQLLTAALQDVPQLDGGLRRVEAAKVQGVTMFRAQFVGLSRQSALDACETLARNATDCLPLAPGI